MENESTMATIKLMNQDLVRLDRFDGTNFTRWQDKLKFLLTTLKIFYILDPELAPLPEPTNGETDAVRAERQKRQEDELICRGHILNALSDRLYDLYTNTSSAKEIWNALENKYKAEEEGTKKFLISRYFDFKFLENIPILPQIHELQVLVNKLKAVKIEIPETFQVGAIIAKLPGTWKGYRKKIMHSSEDYSLEQLQKHLRIEEESRARDKSDNSYEGTSKANAVEKSEPSTKTNKRKPSKNFNNSKKKTKGSCFVCGKSGHYAKECRYRKKNNTEGKVNSIKEDNIVATVSEINAIKGKVPGWWYDTCATIHVSYDKSLFKTYFEIDGEQEIQMGNEVRSKVYGKGNVDITFTSGKTVTLTNVLHVPDMNRNLVSGDLLGKPGIKCVYESGKLVLSLNGKFVGKGYSSEGMVKLCTIDKSLNNKVDFAYIVVDSFSLWHARLGHISKSTMKRLLKCDMISYNEKDAYKCKTCIESKMIKKPYQRVNRTSNILELIHTDICELNGMLTRGGNRYFITFIDDYSRYTYVYLIKHKHEAFDMFKTYKNEVENHLSKKIKILRSDRGGEYFSSDFNSFCEQHGIVHQCSAPRTPEQNGLAERKNRTLVDMINAMLMYAKFPCII